MRCYIFFLTLIGSLSLHAQDLVILHSNDLHSHLNGLAPVSEYTPLIKDNDPTLGGFSRIAGYIKEQREQYGDRLLVLDAGDFLMGTLFQALETEQPFHLNLMKKMGYDFVALGNHEFDLGSNMLANIIIKSLENGEIPQLINTNYLPSKKKNDDQLLALYKNKTILPYSVTTRNGIRIGIFALMGVDANESIPGNYFIRFGNCIATARKTARYLKKVEKADFVIVLSHSGFGLDHNGRFAGEDINLGRAVPGIDLIISAHKHFLFDEPVTTGNAMAVLPGYHGGRIGKVEVKFHEGRTNEIAFTPVEMNDDIEADSAIQAFIDGKSHEIEEKLLTPIGISIDEIVFETDFLLTMDKWNPEPSNLGPFVADAVYHYLNHNLDQNIDVSIVATGIIRHDIVQGHTGRQNISDIFNVMPIGIGNDLMPGSPLGKIYLTGEELKKVFELIMAVYPSITEYYLFFSGMQIIYNPEKGFLKKISEIIIGDEKKGFKRINFSKKDTTLYCISANKYMLGFIGKLKKMSYGTVNIIPKDELGNVILNDLFLIDTDPSAEGIQEAKEWLALYYFVRSFDDENGNGIPDVPDTYRQKTNAVYITNK